MRTDPWAFHLVRPTLTAHEEAFRLVVAKRESSWLQRYQRLVWARHIRVQSQRNAWRLLPAVSMTLGSLLLVSAFWPIISYFLFTSPALRSAKLASPVPEVPVVRQKSVVTEVRAAESADEIRPRVVQGELDYTDLSNWFPTPEGSDALATTDDKEYSISIPSLNIENAIVKIGGTNLDNNLIQYPGTADPGEFGAPVIFGHSTLKQFYNPSTKNPRRYLSLFSKIMDMKVGDLIYVDYDGIRYTYSVQKKVEVKPEDTYILEQEYNARQLKLITCVPNGTYLRRGVVLAQLEKVQ